MDSPDSRPGLRAWHVGVASVLLVTAPALLAACRRTPTAATKPPAINPTPSASPIRRIEAVSLDQFHLFAGSQACVSCHPKEAGQLRTRHAHTMSRATVASFGDRFRRGNAVTDPATGASYRPAVQGKACVLVADAHGQRKSTAVDFEFGAGNHYSSFVCLYEEAPIELRLVYLVDQRRPGLALARSACFRKSRGQLSCVTCHDPHRDANRTSLAEYGARCLSCHTRGAAGQVICRVHRTGGGCVSRHMPAHEVELPSRPLFRTPWIRVCDRQPAPAAPATDEAPAHAAAPAPLTAA
jgi:predicted CXXCH cytochrome family protein